MFGVMVTPNGGNNGRGKPIDERTGRFLGQTQREQFLSASDELLQEAFSDAHKAAVKRMEKLYNSAVIVDTFEVLQMDAKWRLRRLKLMTTSSKSNTPSIRMRALDAIEDMRLEALGRSPDGRRKSVGRKDMDIVIDRSIAKDVRDEAEAADTVWNADDEEDES